MPIDEEFTQSAADWDAKKEEEEKLVRKEQYDFDPNRYPDISTQAEAEGLRANRATPTVGLHLTIGGDIQHVIDRRIERENEERLEFLDDTLESEAQKFERDFDRAKDNNDPEI